MAEEKERKELPQVDPTKTANIDYIEVLGEKQIDLVNNYLTYLGGYIENNDKILPLFDMYIVAKSNVLDKKVLDYLFNLDNDNMLSELVDYELTPLAKEQKCKTEFLNLVRRMKKRRKERIKKQQEEDRKKYFSEVQKLHPYYGKPLSKNVIRDILIENYIDISYNQATRKIELSKSDLLSPYPRENQLSVLPTILYDICKENEVTGLSAGLKMITNYLNNLALENRYNPILDMLERYENDNESYLQQIYNILNLTDDLQKELLRKWLIQCVALAHNTTENPVQAEGVLVLQGLQAKGKTSFFRKLAGKREWFIEGASIDVRNKDTIINALSGWICELGELDSTLKKEQAELKAFITQSFDNIRLPYAPTFTTNPRTTSFCGTVNEEKFLKDTTGNRRFWVIPISFIDKDKLHKLTEEDIFNMWGYIESLYQQDNNSFRLADFELQKLNAKNEEYKTELPFEQEILSLLDFSKSVDLWNYFSPTEISMCIRSQNLGNCTAKQVGTILTKLQKSYKDMNKKRTNRGYKYFLPLNIADVEELINQHLM